MVKIIPTPTFLKHVKERSIGNKRKKYEERLEMFAENPRNPILHNKALKGNEYPGCREFRVSGADRIVFREIGDDVYQFIAYGHKTKLFKKYK